MILKIRGRISVIRRQDGERGTLLEELEREIERERGQDTEIEVGDLTAVECRP